MVPTIYIRPMGISPEHLEPNKNGTAPPFGVEIPMAPKGPKWHNIYENLWLIKGFNIICWFIEISWDIVEKKLIDIGGRPFWGWERSETINKNTGFWLERTIYHDVASSNLMCSMEMLDLIHFSSLHECGLCTISYPPTSFLPVSFQSLLANHRNDTVCGTLQHQESTTFQYKYQPLPFPRSYLTWGCSSTERIHFAQADQHDHDYVVVSMVCYPSRWVENPTLKYRWFI